MRYPRRKRLNIQGYMSQASSREPITADAALASRAPGPDIVAREDGDGRDTRQSGQVRKEAAVTSAVSGRSPASCSFSNKGPIDRWKRPRNRFWALETPRRR